MSVVSRPSQFDSNVSSLLIFHRSAHLAHPVTCVRRTAILRRFGRCYFSFFAQSLFNEPRHNMFKPRSLATGPRGAFRIFIIQHLTVAEDSKEGYDMSVSEHSKQDRERCPDFAVGIGLESNSTFQFDISRYRVIARFSQLYSRRLVEFHFASFNTMLLKYLPEYLGVSRRTCRYFLYAIMPSAFAVRIQ
jgi:hypothetical protein